VTLPEQKLRRRVQTCAWIVIIGLIVGGTTALPLQYELDLLARMFHAADLSPAQAPSALVKWILIVRDALHETYAKYPFIGYGTDWLAFGHFVIAIAFIGVLRHPLRNAWLFTFGMIACVLVVPFALIAGEARDIPVGWRFIDCLFGVFGFIPNWLGYKWTRQLEMMRAVRFD
jgi:hypothetical protein